MQHEVGVRTARVKHELPLECVKVEGVMGWLRRVFSRQDPKSERQRSESHEAETPRSVGDGQAARGPTATCDNCGAPVRFDGDDSGTVTLTFGATTRTTTLCASCTRIAEKEEQWRATGMWVGPDPPQSIAHACTLTDDEMRELFARSGEPEDPSATK